MAIASTSLPSRVDLVEHIAERVGAHGDDASLPLTVPDQASTRAAIATVSTRLLHAVHRPDSRVLAALALVAANALWGTSIVTSRAVLDHIPPLTLAVLRSAIAVAVLLPFVYRAGQRPALGALPALMGFVGLALFYPAFYMGIRLTSAANAALIVEGGIPVATALVAAIALREHLTTVRLLGIAVSALGVVAISLGGRDIGLDSSLGGNLLLCGCAGLFAAYTVVGRRAFARQGLLAVTTGSLIYGTVLLVPAAIVELAVVGASWPTGADIGLVLYLGAGAAALAYLLMGYALRWLEASVVGVFGNIAPLVGVVAAVAIAHESVTPLQTVSGALILGGVVLAARSTSS